jgi:adenylate cyclase
VADTPPAVTEVEAAGRQLRVLMVDDSRAICMAVKHKLMDDTDIVFLSVNDPLQALDAARDFEPTVILLDLEMPGMSGLELLEVLRAEPGLKDVPTIVLSGIADPAVKAKAFLLGANDYAEKHMDTVELKSRIEYHTRAFTNQRRLNQSILELRAAKRRLEVQRDFIRATFGRYLSDEIVDTLLESPERLKLGGEKRVVTIMMADLRGFTSLSERLQPEQVLAIVNNFLRVMTAKLMHHQGTIDEFIGDAILAIFGAPVQRDDDALRGVACALEMQLAMDQVNRWNRSRDFPEIAMGIGVHTGEVVVGNIGSERRAKYGVVGSNVNLTSRIESCTAGGQVLASGSTLEACQGILEIADRIEVSPKGIDGTVTLHNVVGIGGAYGIRLPRR